MIPQFHSDPDIANAANKAWAEQQVLMSDTHDSSLAPVDDHEESSFTTDEKIDLMYQQMQQIMSVMQNINDQVEPLMAKIKQSPLGAMFGM